METSYKRIWEAAYDRGSIVLRYEDARHANRMRLNLYVGIRKYRNDPELDPEFSRKIENLELSTFRDTNGDHLIRIAHKGLNPLLQEAERQLELLSKESPS